MMMPKASLNEDAKSFPSLLTLIKFASAIGYELKIDLAPIKSVKKSKLKNHYADK
jgi:hypothetical protein